MCRPSRPLDVASFGSGTSRPRQRMFQPSGSESQLDGARWTASMLSPSTGCQFANCLVGCCCRGGNLALKSRNDLRTIGFGPGGLAHPLPGSRPRNAIDKTQKARRVDTSLRLKNAHEYTSATPVSHRLQHKKSTALVDRWISRRGIRLHDRYC